MAGDMVTFSLLSLSSILIIVNPLGATLTFVSLSTSLDPASKRKVAVESCQYALVILLAFALAGGIILQLFGITIEAFRIGGGILLFVIGMEMVYARTSRSKLTATEKYESMDAEDIAVTPLAIPMIAGPGAITTTIVLMNEATGSATRIAVILVSIVYRHSCHLHHDGQVRSHRQSYRTERVPGYQPADGDASDSDRGPVRDCRPYRRVPGAFRGLNTIPKNRQPYDEEKILC